MSTGHLNDNKYNDMVNNAQTGNFISSQKFKDFIGDVREKINDNWDAFDAHKNDTGVHMTQDEKDKLAGIEPGAQVNQNAFAQVNDIEADDPSEVLIIEGGTGITVTTIPEEKKMRIVATGEATPGPHADEHITGGSDVIPDATTTSSGLMSAADKQLLDSLDDALAAHMADYVTARQYGVVFDGSTDNSETLQNAIDGAAGKTLQLSEGVCRIVGTTLNINHPIHIKGMGVGKTIIQFEDMGGFEGLDGFKINIDSGKYNAYSFSDLTIKIKGGHGKCAISTPKGSAYFNTFAPTYIFERLKFIGDVEDPVLFGLYDYGWKKYIDVGDSREAVCRDISVYGCYDYTADPAVANTESTAFFFGGLQNEGGVLMPVLDHCFAHYCGRFVEFGYRVSNPKLLNSQAHRCYDGIYSPHGVGVSTDYGVLEFQLSNININAQHRGVYFEKTAYVDLSSIRVTRASGGFDHSETWYGYYFKEVSELKLHQYRAYNEGNSYTNNHVGLYTENCDYVSLHSGYLASIVTDGLTDGMLFKNTTRIDIFGANFNNALRAIRFTTDTSFTPEVVIAGDKYTSSVGSHVVYDTGVSRLRVSRLRKKLTFGVVDDSLTGISESGDTTLYVDTDPQVKRYQFNTGSGPYTYDINLSNDNALEGDTFIIYARLVSANSTVNIKDGSGDTLVTLNTNSPPKNYCVQMVHTGAVWRCISAAESIV